MNRKLAVTIPLLALLCLGLAAQVTAQTRVPGVTSSDYFTYSITSNWQAANASEPVPTWLAEYNQTTQYKVQIGMVSGVNVTSTQLWDFKNGTEVPYLITIDVESGTPYYYTNTIPPFEGIVGANLNTGDLLHPTGNDSVTINQTITRNYAAGARTTNIVELNGPIQNATTDPLTSTPVNETIGNQDVTYYLDKSSGILVERKIVIESFTPQETATITWTLKQTNLWDASPSSNTTYLTVAVVIAIVIIVAVAAALVFKNKRGHRKSRR